MSSLIKKSDIEKSKWNSEIIKQTAQQIIKDFGMFGMDIHFSGNIQFAYDELFDQLDPQLAHLINNDYDKLVSLLYQIDLSEKKIKDAEDKMVGLTLSEMLTTLIIERELIKVLTRIYIKEKGL